jgi:hypothetical protein
MLRSERSMGLFGLVLAVTLLLAQLGAVKADTFTYTVSGTVYYSTGGTVPNAVMVLTVHWGNGGTSQTGFNGNVNGSFSKTWTMESDPRGAYMELEAAQFVGNAKLWSGFTTWWCTYLTETKNVTVSQQLGVNTEAKVAVHVLPHASRTCAKNFPTIIDCGNIQTTEPDYDVDAFPVFFDLVEYQGFDYGLMWPGLYSCAFTSCSALAIGTITWPGDGISHAWYTCQAEPVAVCGWGWMYDSGMICVSPHPTAGGPNIGDCAGDLNTVVCRFCAGIGGYIGDDPCAPTRTEPSSWGAIKAMFH